MEQKSRRVGTLAPLHLIPDPLTAPRSSSPHIPIIPPHTVKPWDDRNMGELNGVTVF